jgi:aldehyde dehydrogenase (NAD+)
MLAVLETLDNGKSIRETRDIDVPLVARHFYHHAGWAQLLESEFPGYEGVGVVGQIIPWNFPLLMLAWKIAPALAAGNTLILKPAEFTPLTALCFAEIAHEVGIPPGVINILTGLRRELVPVMAAHLDVNAMDVWGVPRDMRAATETAAVDNVKRVARPPRGADERFDWLDDRRAQRPEWIAAYLEIKTVWHPIGM